MSYSVTVNGVTYGVLLPDTSTDLEVAITSIDAWRIGSLDVDVIRRIHRPDECPPSFLPLLAWEYSVDEWDPAWTVAVKRNAIKQSLEIHRHKGTAYAVETAIQALDYGAKVEEWFEYGGDPYRFRVTITLGETQVWPASNSEQIARTAIRTKNVRSLLEHIALNRPTALTAYIGAATATAAVTEIAPPVVEAMAARPYLFVAATVRVDEVTRS